MARWRRRWRAGRHAPGMALTVVRDVALGVLLALPCSVVCRGDDYPNRPIHLIVPFLPGGVADVIARPVAERMARSLGEPVVVENRGGVTGTLGAPYVAHAAADAYTLLFATTNEIAMSPTLYRALPYDPATAFAAVTSLATFPNVLVTGLEVPANTLGELVAMARAGPGSVSFASSGVGSTNHLTAELFRRQAGVMVLHVPYK